MKVAGFKAAGVAAGLRYSGRLDLGLIVADEPVAAAGVYTKNRVQAAPVLWSKEKTAQGRARAILVNSGRANACTGKAGLEMAEASARAVSGALGCSADEVLLASTGVIGEPLNVAAMENAMPDLIAGLGEENLMQVAQAMMTTDTRRKTAEAAGSIDGVPFTVAGLAKGSGMICPNMATMLAFVLTDAAVSPKYLQTLLSRGVEDTFNRVTVDGDTSTNDTVFLLAGGRAGNPVLESDDSPGRADFEAALNKVLFELARMLVVDGEGATKLVTVSVNGAVDDADAKLAAMTVANSPLVKTALFGEDANWGRIMMALGRSGARFDQFVVDVSVDDAVLVKDGLGAQDLTPADEVMKRPEFTINIDLKAGPGSAQILTCDFSYDYVKINADYRS